MNNGLNLMIELKVKYSSALKKRITLLYIYVI